jgi:hypothetical protein
LEVLVQEVIAAITTAVVELELHCPILTGRSWPSLAVADRGRRGRGRGRRGHRLVRRARRCCAPRGSAVAEVLLASAHAVLRALRAGQRGLDVAQVELEHVGVDGSGGAGVAPQALRLGVGLDQRDLLGAAAGQRR